MSEINRSLLIVRPKHHFLDWARSLDHASEDLTLEDLHEDSTAYLIPEIWQDSDQQELLENLHAIIFERELKAWWTDDAAWPRKRDLKTFLAWFEVEFHSLVFDLGDLPIRKIELPTSDFA